jgi:hypothetical protein
MPVEGGETVDVFVRDVNPKAVAVVDELAKNSHQSRSKFLANLIDAFAADTLFSDTQTQYAELVNKVLGVIENNTTVLRIVKQMLMESGEE